MTCPNCQKLEKEIKEANIRTARLMTHLKAGDEGYAIQEAQLESLKLQAEGLEKAANRIAMVGHFERCTRLNNYDNDECNCGHSNLCKALSSYQKFKEAQK